MQRSLICLAWGVSAAVASRSGEPTPIAVDGREQASAGRGEFSKECQPFPNQRVVLVTVNGDYVSFFQNWYRFAKLHLQSTEHLYVVAEDQQAATDLKKLQQDSDHAFTLVKKEAAGSSLLQAPWNSDSYGKVVMQRPHEILKLLNQGCTVLYSDIDNAWAEDPFLDIGAATPGNLYVTDDGKGSYWGLSLLDDSSTNYCTCFMYIQPVAPTKQLMEAWSHGKGNRNQPPFNQELQNMPIDSGLQTVVLPTERFPPGNKADKHPGAAVFHANYLVGERAKVEFFEHRGMWEGAPASEFPDPRQKQKQKTMMQRLCGWVGLTC